MNNQEGCKYNSVDRTGLYIMVFLILLATVFSTNLCSSKYSLATKQDIELLNTKIDSLNCKIDSLIITKKLN